MTFRIAAFATLLLAGCGSPPANQQAGGNAQAPDGQAAANAAAPATETAAAPSAPAGATAGGVGSLTVQPGEWEITMEMHATQAAGMPAGMTMPQIPPSTIRSCVTQEQVARANASFLSGGGHAGVDCDYSHVTVAGGRIQGTSTCRRPGMEATVTMDGSFTPTSYDINQQMQSTMHGRNISSTNHLVGHRVGECTPAQAAAAARAGAAQGGR